MLLKEEAEVHRAARNPRRGDAQRLPSFGAMLPLSPEQMQMIHGKNKGVKETTTDRNYTFCMEVLSQTCYFQIFSSRLYFSLCSLNSAFQRKIFFFILMESNLSMFSFLDQVFRAVLWNASAMFYSRRFIVLSMESSNPCFEKTTLYPLDCFCKFTKEQLAMFVVIDSWSLCFSL